jgi:hypothetical protein
MQSTISRVKDDPRRVSLLRATLRQAWPDIAPHRAGLLGEVDDAKTAFADDRENLEWSDGVATLGPNTRWPFTTDRHCGLLFIWGQRGLRCHHTQPTR